MVLRILEMALDRARTAGASYADARSLRQADEGRRIRSLDGRDEGNAQSFGLRAAGAVEWLCVDWEKEAVIWLEPDIPKVKSLLFAKTTVPDVAVCVPAAAATPPAPPPTV